MEPIFEAALERLQTLHKEMEKSLAGLSSGALDWRPGPDMNSLAVLAAHTAGAERFWIGDMMGADSSDRVRPEEFKTTGVQADDLIELLQATLAHSKSTLGRLWTADLAITRPTPDNKHTFSLAWCLAHALEHTAIHVGHIQLTRQLWDQRPG